MDVDSSWNAEQEADDGEDLMFLVHQGLLPLPLRSILAARLVCKHWHQSIGCLISQLTLPFEAWSGSSCYSNTNSSAAAPQQQQRSAALFEPPQSPTADVESADDKETDEAPAADDAGDAVWMPPAGIFPMRSSQRQRRTPAKMQPQQPDEGTQPAQRKSKKQKHHQKADDAAGSSAAAAAVGKEAAPRAEQEDSQQDEEQHREQHESTRQELLLAGQQQHMDTEQEEHLESPAQQQLRRQELSSSPAGAGTAAAAAGAAAVSPSPAAAAAVAPSPARIRAQQQASSAHQHLLQHLPASFPYVTKVTLQCRSRSSSASERALPAADVLAASLQLLGQLPKLHTVLLQGSLPRPMWQPLLAGLQQQQQQQVQGGDAAQQAQPMQTEGVEPALQQQQQQQQQPQWVPSSSSSSSCSLQQKLVCLQLVGCDLPPAVVLDGLLGCLGSLRELLLHASIKSPALQPDHLDALATGTQLHLLSLCVYQTGLGGSSRVQLNPLLALTNLRSLEMAYRGIFNDQRPQLAHKDSISSLVHLTSLSSHGLASPALPHPALTSLHSFNALGLTKRLSGSSLVLVASCSSIRALRIEAGRRGLSAVAAEHLHHLGSMTQLSSISISLSKGGQSASKSTAQLLELPIPGLKGFAVGSGDHRLGFSTEQLQGLAQQWPRLESLRLSSFSPLQGLAGLGAFTSLQSLSLKPGTGTGKLLFELAPALQPLSALQRLHLDFRSALQLEHVQAVADACSSRLQHLSLNMRASSIGSKALESIAQLQQLTSLQLLGTTVGTLAGPPAWQALQSMQGLRWLSVQAAEEPAVTQRPLELGQYLWNGVEALTGLQELRIWLGFGVEGRQAQQQLVARVEAKLHDCRCYVLQESEKPAL